MVRSLWFLGCRVFGFLGLGFTVLGRLGFLGLGFFRLGFQVFRLLGLGFLGLGFSIAVVQAILHLVGKAGPCAALCSCSSHSIHDWIR